MITTCTHCGQGYDAASEEQANEPERFCPICRLPNDIWKDPEVKAALKDGRSADDIAVLRCPKCERWGYYNEGSHFTCRFCGRTWYVCSEDQEPRPMLDMQIDGHTTLADTVTVTTEGYDNETP